MNENHQYNMASLVIGLVIGFIAGTILFCFVADKALDGLRNEAIKAGAAEWTVNPTTGETQFQFRSTYIQ